MKSTFPTSSVKLSLVNICAFILIWPLIAIPIGINASAHIMDWLLQYSQGQQIDQSLANQTAAFMVGLTVLTSLVIAIWLIRVLTHTKKFYAKLGLFSFIILSGLSAIWLFLNPYYLSKKNLDLVINQTHIIFGSYPSLQLLEKLKENGYPNIISLLDPTHVPFEGYLLEKEELMAEQAGVRLIHIPIRPWIAQDEDKIAVEQLKATIAQADGNCYIHCYLGRDRTSLVRHALEQMIPANQANRSLSSPSPFLNSIRSVENGSIIRLDDQVYIYPQMNEEELTQIINANIQTVAILNFSTTDKWAHREETGFQVYSIPYKRFIILSYPYNANALLEIARQVQQLPKPLIIYAPKVDTYYIEAFIQAYRTHTPSLPLRLFIAPLKQGKIGIPKTNIAIGPRPSPEEFKSYLYPRGIAKIIYLGPESSLEAQEDKQIAYAAGMDWQASSASLAHLYVELTTGGPYYLYGPRLPLHQLALAESFSNGPIQRLSLTTYLAPMPSKADLYRYFFNGEIQSVTTLVDESINEKQLTFEEELLAERGIQVKRIYLPKSYNPETILQAAQLIWTLPSATVIQMSNTQSPLAEAIKQAYYTNVPPLAPLQHETSLNALTTQLIAPNVMVGASRDRADIAPLLRAHGIQKIVEMEIDPSDQKINLLNRAISCSDQDSPTCIFTHLMRGGPWYISTPTLDQLLPTLQFRLRPAFPHMTLYYPNLLGNPFEQTEYRDSPLFEYKNYFPLSPLIPTVSQVILLTPLFLLFVIAIASFIGWLRQTRKIHPAYTRKFFHIFIFFTAILIQLGLGFPALLLFAFVVVSALTYTLFQSHDLAFYQAISKPYAEEADRNISIILPALMSGMGALLSFFCFGSFFVTGLAICGFGDATAALIGSRAYYEYRIPSLIGAPCVKTVEGSLAMLLVSSVIGWLTLLLLGFNGIDALWIGAIAALVGTLVEALSNSNIDNFTIQFATTAIVYYLHSLRY